jgi:hypothetical protein
LSALVPLPENIDIETFKSICFNASYMDVKLVGTLNGEELSCLRIKCDVTVLGM